MVSLDTTWRDLPIVEQQILSAMSRLPVDDIDELRLTVGHSIRHGIYVKIAVNGVDISTQSKGTSCDLVDGGRAVCRSVEYRELNARQRNFGQQCNTNP